MRRAALVGGRSKQRPYALALIVVSLVVSGLVALALGVPWGSNTGSASPDLSLTCSVKASCTGSEVPVFRMSALSNAHAGTPGGSTYPNVVCCDGVTGLGNSCSGTYDTVLALSDTDNAHVATTVGGAYTTEVCLSVPSGPMNCSYAATCPTDWACLATISGTTNAHVADCDGTNDYATKVCCSDAEALDCPNPSAWPWPVPAGDADCDGWSNDDEGTIGTDPNVACSTDNWPADFPLPTSDHVIDSSDLTQLLPGFFWGKVTGDPDFERHDLYIDGVIDSSDLTKLLPGFFWGQTCTP